jgi:hypothetical protein
MNYGHDTAILVLNLATQIDTIGLQRFEDLKRKKKSGFLWDSIVFGRSQIICSVRLLSDGVSPIETV